MKIAIIGGGLAGVAVAYHLLLHPSVEVDLYDPAGIAGGASGVAAGLLHPFMGKAALPAPYFQCALQETARLLQVASSELSTPPILQKGIFHPALNPKQTTLFKIRQQQYPKELSYRSLEPFSLNGLYYARGLVVDIPAYLIGIWQRCEKLGGKLIREKILKLASIEPLYDNIVVAAGAGSLNIEECRHLPLTLIKGQLLTMPWPDNQPVLGAALCGHPYLTLKNGLCYIGATFERDFLNDKPDIAIAKNELLPKLQKLLPFLNEKIVDGLSGIRAFMPTKIEPIVTFLSQKCAVFCGLGSRGLLFHAFYASRLADQILRTNRCDSAAKLKKNTTAGESKNEEGSMTKNHCNMR